MDAKIKTEIISRRCIKPTSPTPSHLKSFKLSLLDQLSPHFHSNVTFFFPSHGGAGRGHDRDLLSDFSTKSQLLQTSLSKLLTRFYPLAGRLCDPAIVDCNDDGMLYIEARTATPLSHFLSNPDSDTLELFLPSSDEQTVLLSNGSFFLVQFTLFACGGNVIGISMSHKIIDLVTFLALIQSWTASCQGAKEPYVPDLALAASLLPPREIPGLSASVNIAAVADKFIARRFVFSASMVGELKRRVESALGKNKDHQHHDHQFRPSRVEVVLALIWRCALLSHHFKTRSFKPSALFQGVNLRPRMQPPVPEMAVGNLVWPFMVMVEKEIEMELHELVKKMREGMKEFIEKKARKFREGGGFEAVMEFLKERGETLKKKKETVVYRCTSWCRSGLYEVDYGWGKPVWMSSVNKIVNNTVALMDAKDGGVEALVTLDEREMEIFEQSQELLYFAQLNPSILLPHSITAKPKHVIRAAM